MGVRGLISPYYPLQKPISKLLLLSIKSQVIGFYRLEKNMYDIEKK
jgi:hypothetical protein